MSFHPATMIAFYDELEKLSGRPVPKKVEEYKKSIQAENPDMPTSTAFRIAWKSYHQKTKTKYRTPKKEREKQPLTGYGKED